MTVAKQRRLGSWRPELPDHRDRIFRASGKVIAPRVDPLGIKIGVEMEDQGPTSGCTGHAGTTALEISLGLSGKENQLSRLYAYYKARWFIGETKYDDGAFCRDICKAFTKYGCPHETKWPFDLSKITTAPSRSAVADATKDKNGLMKGMVYESCQTLDQIRGAINDGFAVMFGFTAYNGIFGLNETNYMLPMPQGHEAPAGGHAVCADGYDDDQNALWIENSWGPNWGKGGRFMMPYRYVTENLADDFWIMRKP